MVSSLKTQIDGQARSLHGNFSSLLYYQGQLMPQLPSSLRQNDLDSTALCETRNLSSEDQQKS